MLGTIGDYMQLLIGIWRCACGLKTAALSFVPLVRSTSRVPDILRLRAMHLTDFLVTSIGSPEFLDAGYTVPRMCLNEIKMTHTHRRPWNLESSGPSERSGAST
jgi:hypothetical protein